jgi:hypothetical protein
MTVRPFERVTGAVEHPPQINAVAVHDVPVQADCSHRCGDELILIHARPRPSAGPGRALVVQHVHKAGVGCNRCWKQAPNHGLFTLTRPTGRFQAIGNPTTRQPDRALVSPEVTFA